MPRLRRSNVRLMTRGEADPKVKFVTRSAIRWAPNHSFVGVGENNIYQKSEIYQLCLQNFRILISSEIDNLLTFYQDIESAK